MKARTKFLIGGALILGSAGYLMASAINTTGEYYLTPTELASKVSHDPSFYETGVKVGARVVPGSIVKEPDGREIAFRVTDGAHSYPVTYRGLVPDMFTDSVDVVLEGRLARTGTFQATTVLTKCASRYENAPKKYQSTPGYQTATTTASRS
ncbi:MAG TPA: cytochrome c maturation protein CcmE [Gemmatimonadaceae bacterium]|nr:cytochrome c maturation protein CcmE [Gemmatimonadaceae bacterium]